MSPEVALLHEVWETVKLHAPKNASVEFAEALIRCFDDGSDIEDVVDDANEFDKIMQAAIVSHFGEYDDDDGDADDDDDHDDDDDDDDEGGGVMSPVYQGT